MNMILKILKQCLSNLVLPKRKIMKNGKSAEATSSWKGSVKPLDMVMIRLPKMNDAAIRGRKTTIWKLMS